MLHQQSTYLGTPSPSLENRIESLLKQLLKNSERIPARIDLDSGIWIESGSVYKEHLPHLKPFDPNTRIIQAERNRGLHLLT